MKSIKVEVRQGGEVQVNKMSHPNNHYFVRFTTVDPDGTSIIHGHMLVKTLEQAIDIKKSIEERGDKYLDAWLYTPSKVEL